MTDNDLRDMINRVKSEIASLRIRNAELEPKAHGYDLLTKVIHTAIPDQQQGYSVDILYQLDKELEKLNANS